MRGRKPEPETNVVQANFAREDGLSASEGHKAEADSMAPTYFDEQQRQVWDEIAPFLVSLGRLKPIYVRALAELCETVVMMNELRETIAVTGLTYRVKGRNGSQQKTRPEAARENEMWRRWRSLTAMFGLSPADQRSVSGGGQGELPGIKKNEFAEFD